MFSDRSKRGVSTSARFWPEGDTIVVLVIFVFVLVVCSTVSIADGPPEAGGGAGGAAQDFKHPVEVSTTPTNKPEALRGYWLAMARSGPDAKSEVVKTGDGKFIVEYPSYPASMSKTGDTTSSSTFNLLDVFPNDIYKKFNVDAKKKEITSLIFALEPLEYDPTLTTLGEKCTTCVSSHGRKDDNAIAAHTNRRTGCIACGNSGALDGIDDFSACIATEMLKAAKTDNTCFEIGLLNRRDCSQMADANGPFCEGVPAIASTLSASGSSTIGAMGVSGNGGCQKYVPNPDGTFGEYKSPGRDWDTSSKGFSSDNLVYDSNVVGNCCGNDKEDVGMLKKGDGTLYPNQYSCLKSKKGEFVWGKAGDPGFSFVIFSLNRSKEGVLFDAVSNGENWYFCNASSKKWYDPTKKLIESNFKTFTGIGGDYIPKGVVLGEFAVLPRPSPSFGAGIVAPPPGEAGPLTEKGWGVTTTAPGSSPGTEVVGVENITAGKGVVEQGPLYSTVCDKDGDGYDGAWTTDASIKDHPVSPDSSATWKIDPDGKCSKPSPPFDCHDQDTNVNPGAVEVCANGKDDNCDTHIDEVGCVPATETKAPDIKKDPRTADRFLCFDEQIDKFDSAGSFAECCGYDLGWCVNTVPKARRQGGAIKTLREFASFSYASSEPGKNCINTANCALRYGVAIPASGESDSTEYAIPLFLDNSDAKIRDWRSYKYLEFYVHFTGNFIGNIKVGKFTHPELGSDAKNKPFAYDYYFNEPIIKYAVNEPQLKKWLHIVIPLEKFPPIDQADVVVIASPVKLLKDTQTKITYPTLDGKKNTVRTLISVDKVSLVGRRGNRYCTGTYPSKWTSDLDDLGASADEPLNILAVPGLAACEDTPGFGWTGRQCCGDDTGNDTSLTKFGDDTYREFFNDTTGGCWAGQKIGRDERLMMVKYTLDIPPFVQKKVTRSCKSNSCVYELPFVNNTVVTSDFTEVYDLVIVEGSKRKEVKPTATATSPAAALKAENVPLQVLYAQTGKSADFYGCNAEAYLFDVKNSLTGKPLLIDDSVHNLSSCMIKGKFFCSHALGNDLGWSNEALTNFSSYPILKVSATTRSNEKVSYNLIYNSGFEEV